MKVSFIERESRVDRGLGVWSREFAADFPGSSLCAHPRAAGGAPLPLLCTTTLKLGRQHPARWTVLGSAAALESECIEELEVKGEAWAAEGAKPLEVEVAVLVR